MNSNMQANSDFFPLAAEANFLCSRPLVFKKGNTMLPSRRSFFARAGAGFAGLALIDLLSRDGYFAQQPRQPHFAARAKHCVFLFMNGAPSQVDTFDHKPALTRYHNQPYR